MRILELTDLYPPFIGGLERYVQLLADALTEHGHQVAVATTATSPDSCGHTREGAVDVYRLRGWAAAALTGFYAAAERPFHPTVLDPGMVAALRRVIVEFRPDVVHAHSWNLFSVLPLVRSMNLPVLVTAHDYGLVCAKKTLTRADGSPCRGGMSCLRDAVDHYGPVKGLLLGAGLAASSRQLRKVSRFTAVSQHVADRLQNRLPAGTGPVRVLHSFVPDGLRETGLAEPRPPFLPDGDFLLYVGALSPHKGLHVLLDAHTRLQHRIPLVLAGTPTADTPDPATLPADVTVATNVPHRQVVAALCRATVAVAPSLWPDPLPMTVSEAQLCGAPIVASAVGGIPEQVQDGRTGLLVEPGNCVELMSSLDGLLADPARRAAMAVAGPSWAHRFTRAALLPQVEDELAAAVADHAARTRSGRQ